MSKPYYYTLFDPKKNRYWDYFHQKWTASNDQATVVSKPWGSYRLETARLSSNETALIEWFNYLEAMNARSPRNLVILRHAKKDGGDTIVTQTDVCADNYPSRISLGKIKKKHPCFDADDLFADLFHRFDAGEFKWILSARENFNPKALSEEGVFTKRNTRIMKNEIALKTDEQMAVARMLFDVVWEVDIKDYLPRNFG